MAFLIFLGGDLKGRKFEFDRDAITIGRSNDNTIQLNDPSVSSNHCQFDQSGDQYTVTDIGSTNGSFVNGIAVTETVSIHPKDIVQLGDIEIIFDAPEIMEGDDYAERTTTTGIVVKPGAVVREVSADEETTFTVRKDNKKVWMIVTISAVAAASIAFVWFLMKLFCS
jgi:pSer/pThr/pTyr-binding forkhead associated (FHA) protein